MNKIVWFLLLRFSVSGFNAFGPHINTYEFAMPHIYTDKIDIRFCTQILVHDKFYLVGFEPKASGNNTHHMILYGCNEPGSNDSVWDCGSKPKKKPEKESYYNIGSPCMKESQIIYAWDHEAPAFRLPPDTGFLIGGNSSIKYLVMEVYYMQPFNEGVFDDTGVLLNYTKLEMPRQAGVILLGSSDGEIAASSVTHVESACTVLEDKIIHPFAFHTHTHTFSTVVSGYVVRQGIQGDAWTSLGKNNPKSIKTFHTALDVSSVKTGDVLAERCTMNNTRGTTVFIGRTGLHEVCQFYLMYWVENGTPLETKTCLSAGPPKYYWNRAIENFQNIPDEHTGTTGANAALVGALKN